MHKFIIFILLGLSACSGDFSTGSRDTDSGITTVNVVPSGFIALDTAVYELGGILRVLGWSDNIVFMDIEDVNIFQMSFANEEFIVRYRGEFYVNEKRFLEIVEVASNIYIQFNKIYRIGDVMEIRGIANGARIAYEIMITTTQRRIVDNSAIYDIKFHVSPNVPKDRLLEFFERIETINGDTYHEFILIDEETVRIKIDNNDAIDLILLTNLGRPNRLSASQNSVRRVRIN